MDVLMDLLWMMVGTMFAGLVVAFFRWRAERRDGDSDLEVLARTIWGEVMAGRKVAAVAGGCNHRAEVAVSLPDGQVVTWLCLACGNVRYNEHWIEHGTNAQPVPAQTYSDRPGRDWPFVHTRPRLRRPAPNPAYEAHRLARQIETPSLSTYQRAKARDKQESEAAVRLIQLQADMRHFQSRLSASMCTCSDGVHREVQTHALDCVLMQVRRKIEPL